MKIASLIFTFVDAIQKKRLVLLKFKSKGDGKVLLKTCAPLDIAPSRRMKESNYKFHLWDFDSSFKPHVLSLNLNQIIDFNVLEEQFRPGEFITWNTAAYPWSVKRDWGIYS
jgi:hypothetical protein